MHRNGISVFDEIPNISSIDPVSILNHCIEKGYDNRLRSIFMKAWRLSKSIHNREEIERQILLSNMKVIYIGNSPDIAIPGKIPIYNSPTSVPKDCPSRYILVENGEPISYGFKLPSMDLIKEWNTYVVTIEGEYLTLSSGDAILVRDTQTNSTQGGRTYTYEISCLKEDIDVCEYPICNLPWFDTLSHIPRKYLNRSIQVGRGIVRFLIVNIVIIPFQTSLIVPIIEGYCLIPYSIICSIETLVDDYSLHIPVFDNYLDAILFMLRTKSICYPIPDKYYDMIVVTYS